VATSDRSYDGPKFRPSVGRGGGDVWWRRLASSRGEARTQTKSRTVWRGVGRTRVGVATVGGSCRAIHFAHSMGLCPASGGRSWRSSSLLRWHSEEKMAAGILYIPARQLLANSVCHLLAEKFAAANFRRQLLKRLFFHAAPLGGLFLLDHSHLGARGGFRCGPYPRGPCARISVFRAGVS
jgi:hypothetical protein